MAEYAYEALDKSGRQVKGVIDAGNEQAIIEKLRDLGYYPLLVAPRRTNTAAKSDFTAWPLLRLYFHRIKTKQVCTFTRQLATLIDAGLPIMRSLAILREQVESVVFKDKIAALAKEIESGQSLSDAMAKHPKVFDRLYLNMVRAGEVGGVLERVLNRVAEFLEKREALKSKVKAAMMYPFAVMMLASLIVAFILWKIIPIFRHIFEQLGGDLPIPTQILIAASDLLLHNTIWVVCGVAVIVWGIKKLNRNPKTKYHLDKLQLRLPVLGMLLKKLAITRFAGTLATLIDAGVPILQALDIVRDSSGNEVLARAMQQVYQSVKDGESIHEPLSKCPIFPPLVVHMVAVGEETGAIEHMLGKVAEAYEREVDDTVNALASILEPVLIVFLGIIIGGIVIALYLPIFDIPHRI